MATGRTTTGLKLLHDRPFPIVLPITLTEAGK